MEPVWNQYESGSIMHGSRSTFEFPSRANLSSSSLYCT